MHGMDIPVGLIVAILVFVFLANAVPWIATLIAMLRQASSPVHAIIGFFVPIYAFYWCMRFAKPAKLRFMRGLWIAGAFVAIPVACLLWMVAGLSEVV